jgi:TonB family protein
MGMKKILIVDYDQGSLASLQGVLAGEGYTIVTAADGQAGWDKYNKESPDLVLMEAMLPKVHGFELCQRITSERNSQATVFIMTGVYKDRVYRTEALRTYGASEYFEKPLKMAELLASVQAVLGKPEPKPEEEVVTAEPQAPVREIRAAAAPAEARKREKARSDDSLFSLPEDLDRMARDIPKMRRPAPATHEPSVEPRLEALADDLLKSVIIESKTPKASVPKPGNGNGNGNGNGKAEIDQFMASALAGFDLNKEKIKVPKTAPLPPPPVTETPVPTPPPVVAKEPKPAPAPAPPRTPAPEPAVTRPAPADMKNTLTPGDPGSDMSPFFTPDRPKPAAPVEKPRVQPVAAPPVPAPTPKPAKPAERTAKPPAPVLEQVRPAPAPPKPEPPRPVPVAQDIAKKDIQPTMSGDIFQGIHETREKRSGFPKIVAVGIGVVALAAAGFIFLRPKHRAPAPVVPQETTQALTPSNTPAQPAEEVPPPVVKPAPAKQKIQPKAKPADPEPAGAEAILPNMTAAAAPPLPGGQPASGPGNGQTGSPSSQTQAEAQQAKTEDAPPAKTEAEALQGTAAEAAGGSAAGAGSAEPTPIAPPVNEGDLVELSSVTEVPKLVKSADPVYPQTAQRLGVGGSITVNALIDEKGNVTDTAILKGIKDDKGLGRAAETAVRKWKFQPARKNGVAVKVWKSFVIAFKAEANPANRTE